MLSHELAFGQRNLGVTPKDSLFEDRSAKLRANYIDLFPASLSLKLHRFRLQAGPYVSALTSASLRGKGAQGNLIKEKSIFGDPVNDETQKRYLQKFDFGANLGGEFGPIDHHNSEI